MSPINYFATRAHAGQGCDVTTTRVVPIVAPGGCCDNHQRWRMSSRSFHLASPRWIERQQLTMAVGMPLNRDQIRYRIESSNSSGHRGMISSAVMYRSAEHSARRRNIPRPPSLSGAERPKWESIATFTGPTLAEGRQ